MLIALTDMPVIDMSMSVMRIQIGIESEMMIVVFIPRRKTKMIAAARMTPCTAEFTTSSIVSVIISVESLWIARVRSAGSSAWISGSASRTAFATVVSFASDSLEMFMVMISLPSR